MVRAVAIAALVALAACKVGVEGAPCLVAGSADDCPEGQACGTDGQCSERATECAPLHWDGAACRCPSFAGVELVADAGRGSAANAGPYATGSADPAACRFARLTDALAAAAERAPDPIVVTVADDEGAAVFGDVASGETFPLEVPENVTLRSDAPGGAVLRVVAATPPQIVKLQGAIEGFRIESTSATGAGIAASCAPSGVAPRIANVAVDGGGLLSSGIDVAAEACGTAVEISASTSTASEIGIRVTGGKVAIGKADDADGVVVTANAGDGVVLTGAGSTIDATLVEVVISGNTGTGLVVDGVGAGSTLALAGCDVFENGASSPRAYGPEPQRQAGGVLVRQDEALAAFGFTANRVFGNRGDELVFETSLPWSIAAAGKSCFDPGVSNTFACIGDGALAVAVAGTGSVDASLSVWPTTDWQLYVSPGVTAGSGFCNGAPDTPPVPATCPEL